MPDPRRPQSSTDAPVVLITGVAGSVGASLAQALQPHYHVVGMDQSKPDAVIDWIEVDLTCDESVTQAVEEFRDRHGDHVASVVHLAAYFDFSGEHDPLYDQVNVQGTRRLLRALQSLQVEQFVYSGTMLVHFPYRFFTRGANHSVVNLRLISWLWRSMRSMSARGRRVQVPTGWRSGCWQAWLKARRSDIGCARTGRR